MVSRCCISFVSQVLGHYKVVNPAVSLGYAQFFSDRADVISKIDQSLQELGLGIIFNEKDVLIENIKRYVNQYIVQRNTESVPEFLEKKLAIKYAKVSKLFKQTVKVTLERYVIEQKIARIKQLIREDELSLLQIVKNLQYSSLPHMSAQFKLITGITVTQYKLQLNNQESFDSLKQALTGLKRKGFKMQCEIRKRNIFAPDGAFILKFKDAAVREAYRFYERPTPEGDSVVLKLSNGTFKGYLII